MKPEQVPVAKEGYPFILFAAFFTLTCATLGWVVPAVIGFVTTSFVTWFFRDPTRVMPHQKNALICPADGKVILIKEVEGDIIGAEKCLQLSIFMNVFNVHVNRIPHAGIVKDVVFKPGKFYAADKKEAALYNEKCTLIIETKDNITYGVVQIAGLIARRIICRAEVEDEVQTGERYGLIRFGSRVDLFLPLETELSVNVGNKVSSGETIVGYLRNC